MKNEEEKKKDCCVAMMIYVGNNALAAAAFIPDLNAMPIFHRQFTGGRLLRDDTYVRGFS